VSLLPVYIIEGYITAMTFYGTLTGDLFEEFIIDQLLPLYNVYLGPRSIIVIDNALVYYKNKENIL
jgi:hypothetical protein